MATRDDIYAAIKNADAAGDTDSVQKLGAYLKTMPADAAPVAPVAAAPSALENIASSVKQGAGNVGAGLLRGAGSIGATILAPFDMASDAMAGKGFSLAANQQRRSDMDSALQTMGAEPDSLLYKAGKLGGEVAGTAGVGSALGVGARAAGAAPEVVNALTSAGFSTGRTVAPNLLARASDLGLRSAAGAVTGGASTGLIDPSTVGVGAATGAALPPALKGVGAVAGPLGRAAANALTGGAISPEVQALAKRAGELGIELPADRVANSKPLNALAASLNYVPGAGRAAVESRMQDQLNSAVTRTFGQDSPNVTQALRKAQTDLGGKFDSTLQNNTVKVDPQFMSDLADSANKAQRELGTDGAGIIGKQVDDIIAKAGTGEIDGQAAYNIKKTLDRIGSRNSPEAYYALDLKKALMGALDRSLGPDESAAFAATRKQYGNMLDMQKLAQNGADGDVSIARLANMRNINNPDLQELADISAQFLKTRESAHGAAQRVGAGGLLALGGHMFGGPIGSGAALAGGAAVGRAANMALDSNVARNLLLRPAGSPTAMDDLNQLAGPYVYGGAPRQVRNETQR